MAEAEISLAGMKQTTVDIREAEAHFADYVPLLEQGESILLSKQDRPFAEIRPIASPAPKRPRTFGLFKGQIHVPDDFNAPDLELESLFYDGPIFPDSKPSAEKA